MSYYVYLILCQDGSYYTGHTVNVEDRFAQHERGRGARYTRIHKPKRVVHVEEFRSRKEAIRREKAIKTLSHKAKRRLVDSGSTSTHECGST
ncbi:GIY-YIG nuclease family protein [Candidatus Bathyarchaeota archaeon]|nr:GIY-YIG nuclease family protein [Candidatus Bathyarchaeota archaeon]